MDGFIHHDNIPNPHATFHRNFAETLDCLLKPYPQYSPLNQLLRTLNAFPGLDDKVLRKSRLQDLSKSLPSSPSRNPEALQIHTHAAPLCGNGLMTRCIAYLLSSRSNSVRWKEFEAYAGRGEQETRHLAPKGSSRFRELWTVFHNALDLHGDGHLCAEELATTLNIAGEWPPHLVMRHSLLADTKDYPT